VAKPARDRAVAVIGLGRFGSSLALELIEQGVEVLGIDRDARIVQDLAPQLTHAVVADSSDSEVLRQLGVDQFERVVVGIGTDLETSVLTVAGLSDLGVPIIWAKAVSRAHGRILTRVGAHHVVLPEHDMGERVAHLVIGRMLDYIEFEDGFALAKTTPPAEILNKRLGDTGIRAKYGVTVVCIKPPGEDFTYATTDTVVHPGDVLIVAGKSNDTERFTDLSDTAADPAVHAATQPRNGP
jgi:trk system potassium uptake protein TrkA